MHVKFIVSPWSVITFCESTLGRLSAKLALNEPYVVFFINIENKYRVGCSKLISANPGFKPTILVSVFLEICLSEMHSLVVSFHKMTYLNISGSLYGFI